MLVIPLVLTILAKVVLPKFVMQSHLSFLEALYLSMRLSWTMHGFWQLGFGLFFSEVEIAGSSDNPKKVLNRQGREGSFHCAAPSPRQAKAECGSGGLCKLQALRGLAEAQNGEPQSETMVHQAGAQRRPSHQQEQLWRRLERVETLVIVAKYQPTGILNIMFL